MPEHFNGPTGAVFVNGKYITVNEHGHVVELHELTDSHDAPAQPVGSGLPFARFRLKIEGEAPLADLVRMAGQHGPQSVQQAPQYAPAYDTPPQSYNFSPPPQPMPFSPYDGATEQMFTASESAYKAPQESNQSWHLLADEEADDKANEVEYIPRPKRRFPKRILTIAALAAAVASGPIAQASYSGSEAVEVCAKDGIMDILGNPVCFGTQYLGNFSVKNWFNYFPPEQK
jgi:hypothetical protein